MIFCFFFKESLYPCDKQGYCNFVLDFFTVNNLLQDLSTLGGTLVHNEFKFLTASCT